MTAATNPLDRAIALMRAAQEELDQAGYAAAAAHLETALGFAEIEAARHDTQVANAN